MTDSPKIDYSIVIPVYFNEGNLKKTFEKLFLDVVKQNLGKSWELIFVDDGSQDGSFNELLEIKKIHPDLVKIIKFTRNFGQVPAIIAGYELAQGKCIINISADLQDPPELINQMLDSFFNENYEVVICSRESREETLFRRWTSKMFYTMIKKLSFQDMPQGGFDFILLSHKAAKFIVENHEANPFLQGQILWTGFRKKFIPYRRLNREIGTSRWTFGKKLKYLLDGILGYSYFPLRIMSISGLLVALCGFLYAVVIVFARFYADVPFQGWAPIMIIILVLSGFQMLMLGIIGEYLWRTLDQVRNRKPYIIEKVVE